MIEYPKQGIISKPVLSHNKNEVTLFCMAGGSSMGEHTSTKSGFVYVLEGNGIFNLKGKKIKMLPGTFIFMNKND